MTTPSAFAFALPLVGTAAALWAADRALGWVVTRDRPIPGRAVATLAFASLAAMLVAPGWLAWAWRLPESCARPGPSSTGLTAGALALAWVLGGLAGRGGGAPWVRGVAAVGRWGAGGLLALGAVGLALPAPPPFRPESEVIGGLRTLLSAQDAYRSVAGVYGSLDCLAHPERCVPGYEGPAFVDPPLTTSRRAGYVWALQGHSGSSPAETTGLESFAVTAVPERRTPGTCCSFCADSTGRMCFRRDGSALEVAKGRCPTSCEPLDSHAH